MKDRFGYPKAPEFNFVGVKIEDGDFPPTVRSHEDTLICMVTSDLPFSPSGESSRVSVSTKLKELNEYPKAMEIIYQYVPQLKEYKLNELTLNLSLSNLLLWSGYNDTNPFTQTPGDPEVDEFISALNNVLRSK